MRKRKFLGAAAVLTALLLAGCGTVQAPAQAAEASGPESSASAAAETEDTAAETTAFDPVNEADLTLKNKDVYSDYTGVAEINLSDPAETAGVRVSGSVLTITADGTYVLTGSLPDGQIVVDAGDAADVRLVLENAEIACSAAAPLYAKSADKVILSLPEGTVSRITDSVTGTDEGEELTAAVYSACDLTVNGSGTLYVAANAKDAIASKDDLKLNGGTLVLTAADDGLVGKDSVQIFGGTIDITAQGDGIKSTKAEAGKGFVYIGGGTLTVDAGCDGIQAETSMLIAGGDVKITTGGGSANAAAKTGNDRFTGWASGTADTDAPSEKGIKAQAYLDITGGTLVLDTTDDSVHCNGTMTVSGGTIIAESGDDGLHADQAITISDGSVSVLKSYEGIEASEIVVDGGEIAVTAQDDGFNAAGGTDGSSVNGRPGQNAFAGDAAKSLTFNGGTVTVDAGGDGLDSNGSLTVNGGTICVSGPTDSANGTFDSGTGFTVNGGVLLGVGSAGMMETPGEDSAQNTVSVSCTGQAGSTVEIRDAAGKVLVSYTVPKSFSVVTFSTPEIAVGETYAVYVDGTEAASAACTGVVTGGAGGFAAGGRMQPGGDPGMGKDGGMRGNPRDPSVFGEGEDVQKPMMEPQ
ncbi:MAG: carbohydrate-binding domain-containing protein [Hominenteromicrobium sp.]